MKKLLSVLIVLFMLLTIFSACGAKKEYVIVTDNSFAPFCYVDDKDNPVGFDVELLQLIAKAEGLKLNIIPVSLIECFEAVDSNSADALMAAIIASEQFEGKYDYSDNYYGEYALAVNKGDNAYLIEKFNDGLLKVIESGKYNELLEKYALGEADYE